MSLSREPLCQLSESPHSPEQSTHISFSLHTASCSLQTRTTSSSGFSGYHTEVCQTLMLDQREWNG